jgi:chitin disaccharide deacetylase
MDNDSSIMLIVNADDFGYNADTNAAIMRSFERRLCSSATLMANMQGFEEACELIHKHGLVDHVGLHLNLSEGVPLTEKIRRSRRFCNKQGEFRLIRNERVFSLEKEEREILAAEIRAQIQRLKSSGIPMTHMDSHKNIHEEWAIFNTVLPLVKEAGIPYIRLSRNIGQPSAWLKIQYRNWLNWRLRRAGLARTRFFGSIRDFDYEQGRNNGGLIGQSCEIMVHPGFTAEGELTDFFCNRPLEQPARQNINPRLAVSFNGSRYDRAEKFVTS